MIILDDYAGITEQTELIKPNPNYQVDRNKLAESIKKDSEIIRRANKRLKEIESSTLIK